MANDANFDPWREAREKAEADAREQRGEWLKTEVDREQYRIIVTTRMQRRVGYLDFGLFNRYPEQRAELLAHLYEQSLRSVARAERSS